MIKTRPRQRCLRATVGLAARSKSCYKPTLRQKQQPAAMLTFGDVGGSISFCSCRVHGAAAAEMHHETDSPHRNANSMVRRKGAFRCAHAPYAPFVIAWLAFTTSALAQLRDSFEGRELTWQLSKEADCGVRVLTHDRPYRESHSGQSCEHFQLAVSNGTFLPLVTPIGRAPLIQEFKPTIYVKADRPSVQLMARVVFPRNVDRGSGQPITSLLRGDLYTDVGQWQQLAIRDIGRLLDQETRSLRTRFGSQLDPREAYVDLIVLNAYSAPGIIDLFIDDLEINGYINLDSTTGPQVARRSATPSPSTNGADAMGTAHPTGPAPATAPPPSVQGSLLMVRGRPLLTRAIQHRGEPFEWLSSLGFNTIKLSASPSAAELKEARRLNLSLIAPPPYLESAVPTDGSGSVGAAHPTISSAADEYEPVIAWSLGTRLTERDLPGTRDLATEARNSDSQRDRPLLVGADSGIAGYSRLAHLLLLERPTLGTTQELADLRQWLLARARLARPGTPILAAIETQRSQRLREQLILWGQGAAWEDDVDPLQLRLQIFHAIAAGARGFVFASETPLAIDTASAALRTDAIRLINMELKLLEPWIAAGQLSEEMAAGDGSLQVSVLATDRSRLLILTQHAAAQQYVLGPPPRSSLSVVVPGAGAADEAYAVSLAGIKRIKISHTSGGARVVLDDAPHAAAVVVTQDQLAINHLYRTLDELKKDEVCRLRYDVTSRRLAHTTKFDARLNELGHPLPSSSTWLAESHSALQQAARLLEKNDFESCHALTTKAESLLARVRRGHWEHTAAAFPTPAARPAIAQFTTLPLHWIVAERISKSGFGPNVQPAGDMESLEQMLKSGWQRTGLGLDARSPAPSPPDIATDVSLSLADPRAGRSALRLQAWATDPKRVPAALERPPVWVVSGPVPARQGQLARIHGWVNVPRRLGASTEGLLVFDSLGGADLGDRIRATQGWREFTLYRAVPQNGELTVTFALTGLGEASIDDLSVSLLDPEPIRPR